MAKQKTIYIYVYIYIIIYIIYISKFQIKNIKYNK